MICFLHFYKKFLEKDEVNMICFCTKHYQICNYDFTNLNFSENLEHYSFYSNYTSSGRNIIIFLSTA